LHRAFQAPHGDTTGCRQTGGRGQRCFAAHFAAYIGGGVFVPQPARQSVHPREAGACSGLLGCSPSPTHKGLPVLRRRGSRLPSGRRCLTSAVANVRRTDGLRLASAAGTINRAPSLPSMPRADTCAGRHGPSRGSSQHQECPTRRGTRLLGFLWPGGLRTSMAVGRLTRPAAGLGAVRLGDRQLRRSQARPAAGARHSGGRGLGPRLPGGPTPPRSSAASGKNSRWREPTG